MSGGVGVPPRRVAHAKCIHSGAKKQIIPFDPKAEFETWDDIMAAVKIEHRLVPGAIERFAGIVLQFVTQSDDESV